MKEYTGDKLFRAQKVIASLKEAFEYNQELYKQLFGNLTIKKYRKNDDETHELVYVGDIDGIGLQFTVLFNKHLANRSSIYILRNWAIRSSCDILS